MSKASEFVKHVPEPFKILGQLEMAYVTRDGRLRLDRRGTIDPQDALRLRDWLTDTFDEAEEGGK
jgi:hypothetical protein